MYEDKYGIELTKRDLLVRTWLDSMEMTRDFRGYANEVGDGKISSAFAEFAEDEGRHASRLLDMIKAMD